MKKVIYIPGLGHERIDLSVKSYALRLMKAVDENHPRGKYTYRIESTEKEYDNDGSIADVVSIYEKKDKAEKEIYRLYEFRYSQLLTARFSESNLLLKFTTLLLILLTRFKSVIHSLLSYNDEVNGKSKVQALYFTLMYILLAVYLVMLIPALLSLFASFAGEVESLELLVEPLKQYENETKALLGLFATFMLFSPNTKGLVTSMAAEYLSVNQYLSIGEQRLLMVGKLTRLLEMIAEEDDQSEIEVHSYSFGSVLAIDMVFPYESQPSERIQQRITRLVTIGCPFDFIEIYWRNYFTERSYSKLALASWININSDLDVLSTRFSGFPKKQERFVNNKDFWDGLDNIDTTFNMVNPKQVSFFQMILFYGLRAHQMYWDENVDSKSCLFEVARRSSG